MLKISKWELIKLILFDSNLTISMSENSMAWHYYTDGKVCYILEITRLD